MTTQNDAFVISTPRLILRRWREDDRAPFAAMNADSRVMEHFPAMLTREESDAMIDRIEAGFGKHGFGLWAVEVRATGAFAGFVGLNVPTFTTHFTPCVEIGWRLAFEQWGFGYAREAAATALHAGFKEFCLQEIVSFTVPANTRSIRVMEAIGMTHDPADDFDHPRLPEGHRLQRHVLYRAHPGIPL
jgi:RimJ/RimL family protein N-acetyltransferase